MSKSSKLAAAVDVSKLSPDPVDEPEPKEGIYCIARTLECSLNNGYNNFKIVTMVIKNGKVVETTYSDPFALFEAIAKLQIMNDQSSISLNMNWQNGLAWAK